MDINKAYVDINERNYQRTKAYFEEGIKSKIDLVNAEVNLSDSKVTLVNAQKTYKKQKKHYVTSPWANVTKIDETTDNLVR